MTNAHQVAQRRLQAVTVRQMAVLWPALRAASLDGMAVDEWLDRVVPVLEARHAQSAALARRYYAAHRRLAVGDTPPPPQVPPTFDVDGARGSLVVKGPGRVRLVLAGGRTIGEASRIAATEAAREATRIVSDGGRRQIIKTVGGDRTTVGWARQTDGDACAFCAMLASRGPVYKSADRAVAGDVWSDHVSDFRAHASCGCVAVPVYSSDQPWPDHSREWQQLWQDEAKGRDLLNEFRRALNARRAAS